MAVLLISALIMKTRVKPLGPYAIQTGKLILIHLKLNLWHVNAELLVMVLLYRAVVCIIWKYLWPEQKQPSILSADITTNTPMFMLIPGAGIIIMDYAKILQNSRLTQQLVH